MSTVPSKVSNKTLYSQARETVSNVHELMRREGKAGDVLVDLKKVQEPVTQATCVSKGAVVCIN